MSKNKRAHRPPGPWSAAKVTLLAHTLCWSMGPALAQGAPQLEQSIAEFLRPSPEAVAPNTQPKPLTPWPKVSENPAHPRGAGGQYMPMHLVGIYGSKSKYVAEFNIGGNVHYLELTDRIQDGWRIAGIDAQSVDISRCPDKKPCQKKTLHLEAQ